jgi:futalosine hydrolase
VSRWLIAVAVQPEADAVAAAWTDQPPVRVVVVGVGAAAAAAATARELAVADARGEPYTRVLSAGIGGGFAGAAAVGGLAIADAIIAADLGAESPDGFLTLDELGFGTGIWAVDPEAVADLAAACPAAAVGPILSVNAVTGTEAGTEALRRRYPTAVAEAMEGFGVATAAAQAGLGAIELRAISNVVGPRDRESWRIGPALAALTEAAKTLHDKGFFG